MNMLWPTLALLLAAFTGRLNPPKDALNIIHPSEIRRHVDFLASDSLKGRNTPSPELKMAAQYIAREFESYGLEPPHGSYFQPFKVSRIYLGKPNHLSLIENGTEQRFKIKRDYMPYDITGSKTVEAGIVFAGYGITAPEYGYNDYQGVDVAGKVVLIFRHEPGEKQDTSRFAGRDLTIYGQIRWKVEHAIEKGAVGVMLVTDPLNHRSIRPRGYPWPSLYRKIPDEAVPLTLALQEKQKVPVVHVGKRIIKKLFGSVDSLKALQERIDRTLTPKSFEIPNIRIRLQTTTRVETAVTQNVVGYLEGRDHRLKNEVIVLGAHYDHVGYKRHAAPGEDGIYNGADDNASGTSLLLTLARAFGHMPQRPKRSLLFIAFAGEEKGLFGSRVYVKKPLFPLEQTVAMVNFDMVGRNAPDSIMVSSRKRSPDLMRINEEENRYIGLKFDYSLDKFYTRSDQFNFAVRGVPFLFYSSGLHEDYHRVSDHAYKINEYKIAMLAKLAFRVVWRIANTDQRFRLVDPAAFSRSSP